MLNQQAELSKQKIYLKDAEEKNRARMAEVTGSRDREKSLKNEVSMLKDKLDKMEDRVNQEANE